MNPLSNPTLADWLTHFEQLHPVGIDMGLERVKTVWQRLCHSHQITRIAQQKIIIVSGTNGKGSVCQMLSLLLFDKQHRVGVYTSPHIHHFSERVQIDGQAVDDDRLIQAFAAIESARGNISLSYFEATTLVGLLVFAWQKVDFAILEVGLGGRLDAINIIDADAAVLTSVGLDHQAFLGDDLAQIALEKAAVFRPQKPAVYAAPHVLQSVLDFGKKNHIPLFINGRDYTYDGLNLSFNQQLYPLPQSIRKHGEHQLQNVAAVMVLLLTLKLLPPDYQSRLKNFALPGRLQVIAHSPTLIVDVAHNVDAAQALAKYIRQQPVQGKNYAVVGMLKDKDLIGVLSAFAGLFSHVYFGSTWGERGCDSQELLSLYRKHHHTPADAYPSLAEAVLAAKTAARPNDTIYAFGSFLVAEALIADKT